MIAFIKGNIEEINEKSVIIDCNGVGYEIYMTARDLNKLADVEDKVKINTYHYIREDQEVLYGFLDKESINMFSLLIGVSGVGTKAGLSILSSISLKDIILSIMTGNEKALCKCPGIGKKIAQRIILELKDKLKKYGENDNLPESYDVSSKDDEKGEAIGAMIALGYTNDEAMSAVHKVYEPHMNVEDIVKKALKYLMKG